MFGLGGVYVEVLKDVTLRLAPVDRAAAQGDDPRDQGLSRCSPARAAGRRPISMRSPMRWWRCRASRAAHPNVTSAEINPFIALPQGGVAVDALILTERERT